MDQHRAQISAEWIDTITGEISTARIAPADPTTVRRFLARFDGADLEVALEATTGWRFVVEELQRVGADVHLAEPAETSGLKGRKRSAKTDWGGASRQAPEQSRSSLLRTARRADRREPRLRRDRAEAAEAQLSRPARSRQPGARAGHHLTVTRHRKRQRGQECRNGDEAGAGRWFLMIRLGLTAARPGQPAAAGRPARGPASRRSR